MAEVDRSREQPKERKKKERKKWRRVWNERVFNRVVWCHHM